uniref:H0813E03.2 protein n=1 Tax=Oryza sativa TaxID=4530 RepID=Q01LP0_ORYSA|nr:H0813E03.2 [Oryza sativa]
MSIGVREIIPLAHWFSHQYAAISHTATSIGVREIIPLAHWFSHQYATISHTATSIGVREIILLAHWFLHQYIAISRTLTSSGRVTTTTWSSTSDVAFLPPLPLQVVELRLLPGSRPVIDQRRSVSPTTSTSSGRVTTTAWFSTSDVAFLPPLPLQVVELRLLPGSRPAIQRFSHYFHF